MHLLHSYLFIILPKKCKTLQRVTMSIKRFGLKHFILKKINLKCFRPNLLIYIIALYTSCCCRVATVTHLLLLKYKVSFAKFASVNLLTLKMQAFSI